MQHNDSTFDLLPSPGARYSLTTKINSDFLPSRKDKTRKTPDTTTGEINPITTSTRSESSFGISLKVVNYARNSITPQNTFGSTNRTPKQKDSKRPNTAPLQISQINQKRVSFSEAAEERKARPNSTKTPKLSKTPPLAPGFIDYKRFVKPYSNLSEKTYNTSSTINLQNQAAHPTCNSPSPISSGKMKALSVEMEVHMLENIERLKSVEENEFGVWV